MFTKYLNKKGFTLVEMIFAIFVLSLIIQLIMALMTHSMSIYRIYQNDFHGKFNHFLNLLDRELDHYHRFQINRNSIIMYHRESGDYADIEIVNGKIAKGPGHQILLYQVRKWQITEYPGYIFLQIEFNNQEHYQGWVEINEK